MLRETFPIKIVKQSDKHQVSKAALWIKDKGWPWDSQIADKKIPFEPITTK